MGSGGIGVMWVMFNYILHIIEVVPSLDLYTTGNSNISAGHSHRWSVPTRGVSTTSCDVMSTTRHDSPQKTQT